MRIEIGRMKLANASEVTFFLDRVDSTGELFYVRVSPRGGVLWLSLDDARGQPFYSEALEIARAFTDGADGAE